MPRNHLAVVKAVLAKTVARGATKGEEEAAVAKAVEMMGKYHIPHSAVASVWPAGWDFQGKRTRPKAAEATTPFERFWQGLIDVANRAGKPGPNFGEAHRLWKKQTEPASAPQQRPKMPLGEYARDLLKRNIVGVGPYSYAYILQRIHERYPGSKTTVSSLRWYENQMRKSGWKAPAKRPAK